MAGGTQVEVAVVGGGPAGLTAAIALASAGIETALISRMPPADNRTTALWSASVTAMEALGVWSSAKADAAALTAIRLIDDTKRLIRAPEVLFEASEIGLEAFGYNIANRYLLAALNRRAAAFANLVLIDEAVTAVEPGQHGVTIRLDGGATIATHLVVAADGRKSVCRAAAGIQTERREYPQAALTLNLAHARPHGGTSTEFHTESGPFTLVPLPRLRSSLVCVVDPQDAKHLTALDDAALSDEIERRSHSILGKVRVEEGRAVFPLAIETAHSFAKDRIALVGEAAHVIPPIGAQGLNLGLRDVATISELVVEARRAGGDVGAAELLARYDRARRADVTSRAFAVDALNRSLLSDFLPVQGARG
ncbi:MAG: 2-octaprenyl-6-methoxyphenol hydroxylase, partial [Hyphomicrobiales bacterium]|nr:2-octaprenyl-6-methoxyphenol hydroxylase [Hyphomicrobiales bacterium]